MIDKSRLLASMRAVVTGLEDDIRQRLDATQGMSAGLAQEYRQAIAAGRTSLSVDDWREGEITQAAVAWVLGCVFVRFVEDNGLIDQPLISGPGDRRVAALGRREEHFRSYPEHSDREYLEDCFRHVSTYAAVAPLYERAHNPLWRLGPSADGARGLREAFTAIDPATGQLVHDFADRALDTRFLGDLYQDLSDAARKRYALLQTPEFVESFILDRTLEPAIGEFGLQGVRIIDPTCGSGHFLIDAFDRLFARWQANEPGTPATVLAQRAFEAVYGVDLNPYATAITKFRLVIAGLRACGISRLAEAPAFELHIATGDSLLHGAEPGQFGGFSHYREGIRHVFETEDAPELSRILGQGYHAVVGNPPYITGDDKAQREAYRARYRTCSGHFSQAVPFMERFFDLARPEAKADRGVDAGFVGQITANSFTKREFGQRLVEEFLPSVDVSAIIDTSGAYIPGHGTPTMIVLGRGRDPVTTTLRVLDNIRTEATQPPDPANGLVWRSIVDLIDRPGERNEYMSANDIARAELLTHPMALGIGREVKKRIERVASTRVGELLRDAGYGAVTRQNELYDLPLGVARRKGIAPEHVAPLVGGDAVRDWAISVENAAIWPYNPATLEAEPDDGLVRFLWPYKRLLRERVAYGKTQLERGLTWFEYSMFFTDRFPGTSIAWSFVSTHNNFVVSRERRVFQQAAPIAKLSPAAAEDDYLRVAAVLNSSVLAFWLKQVAYDRGGGGIGGGIAEEAWERFYEFSSARIAEAPIVDITWLGLAHQLDQLGRQREALLGRAVAEETGPLGARLAEAQREESDITKTMIGLQEELDWMTLAAFGLVPDGLSAPEDAAPPLALGERSFEIALARKVDRGELTTTWFERHGGTPTLDIPTHWPDTYRRVVEGRLQLLEADADVELIERPEHKRRWARRAWSEREREALTSYVLDELESPSVWRELRLMTTAELTDNLRGRRDVVDALERLADRSDADLTTTITNLVLESSVPCLAALRFTEKGMRKHLEWQSVWELQRKEELIEARVGLPEGDPQRLSRAQAEAMKADEVGTFASGPRYAQADFRSPTYWRLRGKLDIPKERFALVPGAERGADSSPVVGWSGWDERDLTRALAARVTEIREFEGAESERILPLLGSILEALPWIHHWHPTSDSLYGGPPGRYFDDWLDGQLAELGTTREDLRSWRPPTIRKGRRKAVTS